MNNPLHSDEKLKVLDIPIIMQGWLDETTRLVELLHVLWRSVSYTHAVSNSTYKGDDKLIAHIRDSLDELYGDIEEVKSRLRNE